MGESGCGKSTIAGILAGKNKNDQGEVCIGQTPLENIREEERMKHITLVTHNSYLFQGTVEENLRMAKPDAELSEMREALQAVNLLDFLNDQDGLQTKLTEKAENFSGGQRQRLALARALLHDTPIYIFDEAASNIDAESEEMIMDVIRKLAETKTVLLISHRLSNVTECDRIYMMEGGQIKEQGTHDQLISRKENTKCYIRNRENWNNTSGYRMQERRHRMHHNRRSAIKIMSRLIVLVRPLIHLMVLAVLLGSAGYLCAIFLTIAAAYGLLRELAGITAGSIFIGMGVMAVMRGILHYAEQYCNHYIAFRLLAIIRHKVFAALRRLCPAKLEGREKEI